MNRLLRILIAVFLLAGSLTALAGDAGNPDEFAYANLRNRLFQLEKRLAELTQKSDLPAAERVAQADRLQKQLKDVKNRLAGHFPEADIALGDAVEAIQEHGSAWFLRYLTHGRYTGRKAEHHKPLEAVNLSGKNPNLAGRAALPLLGYPLMVILSYDAVSREAYREFIPQMEDIVREMEKAGGKPCDFWDRHPTVIPNDLGWDVDRFWNFAQQCASRAVTKYFWNRDGAEVRQATNLVALIIATSFLNNVTIDLDGDKESQSKRAFWRANAAPWFTPDKSIIRNKFHIFHFFTHAWLTYLKFFNDTRFDDRILEAREAKVPTRSMLRNAFWFSNIAGVGYEAISTFAGTKHGFLETTAVHELPRSLKKVAQILHLRKIVGFESVRDIADNREGAWYGAALFLTNADLPLSELARHKQIVLDWQKSLKDGAGTVEPETGGPLQGQARLTPGSRLSLYDLNSPEGKQRIDSGFFREVFRGMGAFEPASHAAAELQAFRFLIGEELTSYNLRQLYNACAATMDDPGQAYQTAKLRHAALILCHFAEADQKGRAEIFRDLFANEGGRAGGNDYNHEADYVYATRKAEIAGCYGPIVLAIREKTPRGLDLNKIAATYKYYTAARFLKSAIHLRWKTMLGDYILDKDEYLIPSYVPAAEISGFVARSPKARVVKSHIAAADKDFAIALKAPPILRQYQKRTIDGYLVIDVTDGEGRLIKRLSESPDDTPTGDAGKPSPERLPEPIQAAWNEHLKAIRK